MMNLKYKLQKLCVMIAIIIQLSKEYKVYKNTFCKQYSNCHKNTNLNCHFFKRSISRLFQLTLDFSDDVVQITPLKDNLIYNFVFHRRLLTGQLKPNAVSFILFLNSNSLLLFLNKTQVKLVSCTNFHSNC